MSWSLTFIDIQNRSLAEVSAGQLDYIESQHPEYLNDLALGFELAKALGLASGVITGMRTPNPYNDDEVVDVSVRGMKVARDFNQAMHEIIRGGPDAEAVQRQREANPRGS